MDTSPNVSYRKIKAIPQTYRGVRFRSTLEADWAATLDTLGIEWQYEPEAIELPSGEQYRPDFYLPQCATWLEVKGPHDDRLHKTMELGETAAHYPDCDGIWRSEDGRDLELKVYDGDIEGQSVLIKTLTSAPDGDTRIVINKFIVSGQGPKTVATYRPRRRVQVNREAAAAIERTCLTSLPCCEWFSIPWRLTVIGRAPMHASAAWESAQGLDVIVLNCGQCNQRSFFDGSMDWNCRRCESTNRSLDEEFWVSASGPAGVDRIPFVRAPRRSGER